MFPRANHYPLNDEPQATARWMDEESVINALAFDENAPGSLNAIPLGRLTPPAGYTTPLEYSDDGLGCVVAQSRGGKSGVIIPSLLSWVGGAVINDPKGENYAVTADYRRTVLKQTVIGLAPFDPASTYRFNPLDLVDINDAEAIDDVTDFAEALIIRSTGKDGFWDDSARSVLLAVMLFLVMSFPPGRRGLKQLREYVTLGLDLGDADGVSRQNLLFAMQSSTAFDGVIAGIAQRLLNMSDNEASGVWSTVERHTAFLDSPGMRKVLDGTDFNLDDLRSEQGLSLYLILPEYRMETHSRWLRLMLTTIIIFLQKNPRTSRKKPSVLLLLDEFSTLGALPIMERAAGYLAGFGVKILFIIQDLNQLKHLYPKRWETFIGNSSLLIAFANTDLTTLDYLSKRLGQCEISQIDQGLSHSVSNNDTHAGLAKWLAPKAELPGLGAETVGRGENTSMTQTPKRMVSPLLHPDEIARLFGRETGRALVLIAGSSPFWVEKFRYYDDPLFRIRAAPNPFYQD